MDWDIIIMQIQTTKLKYLSNISSTQSEPMLRQTTMTWFLTMTVSYRKVQSHQFSTRKFLFEISHSTVSQRHFLTLKRPTWIGFKKR